MSIVLQGQPYAIYPSAYNPYEPANYKRFAAYSSLTKFDHEDCGDIHENGSSNEIRPEILSAKYSCSRESREQRPLEIPRRPVTSGHMKQAERRPQFKIIRKQLQENNDLGVNWLLTSKINLIPRPITSVTRKTIIPTPNMDMFEVKNNDFDNRNSVIKVTSASLIHPNCLPDRRPQSAASSNLASFHLTSPGTSRNISASTPRVTTPVSHLSARSTEVTKPDRPSSAPCFVKQSFASSSCGEKSQSYVAEDVVVQNDSTDGCTPNEVGEQTTDDRETSKQEEVNKELKDSTITFDKKLLKECKIILEDGYDRALRRYGWRMEIPGDPLNLKAPLLPKRLPYTVKFQLLPTQPQPPKMKKQNIETFFQPTIKVPLSSFTVHPDFTSECYNTHRNYLIKNGLWNYATRNYSFAY